MKWIVSLVLLSTLSWAAPTLAAPQTEVINLNYSLAEQVLPALTPMLRDDERASAYGNQLIVRAEPARLAEIRELLQQLDRRPAKLLISVANTGDNVTHEQGYQVNGRVSSGPVDIVVGQPGQGNQARVIRRQTRGADDSIRQISANEGYPVLIQSGQSVPLTSTTTDIYGRVVQQTEYRDVTQGFYATVRLNGDIATISLSANHDRLNRSDSRLIDVQQTDTVVTARLGEWITVGGLDDSSAGQSSDIGRRISTRGQHQYSVRLMVERLE
ncbi:secretin N-terminal domain-containing protein [Halopseudomonas phragmitis]|uniref:NolW-like domain-containing protein n=1 Tax=Halopseudomonas phragmitis TaxID=1931241 RepID=A0A1V0B7D9_9GAMM|nr:secretin N-terminal domain-containing protein [Halopseudomonas phragmitis]AQZ95810.1 hypothetical protein BVH74_14080 [Halopseudomonas phragmitis]